MMEMMFMEQEMMAHEAVRAMTKDLTEFLAYEGDWGWLVRGSRDLSVKLLRSWMRYYKGPCEDMAVHIKQTHAGVRVVLYEAVRRTIAGAKDDILKTAYVSTTQALRVIHPPPTTKNTSHRC